MIRSRRERAEEMAHRAAERGDLKTRDAWLESLVDEMEQEVKDVEAPVE